MPYRNDLMIEYHDKFHLDIMIYGILQLIVIGFGVNFSLEWHSLHLLGTCIIISYAYLYYKFQVKI